MENASTPWLLLIVSLPTTSNAGRMRVWRALKACGSAALRDGAYLLPNTPVNHQLMRELADDTRREGGSAWLLGIQRGHAEQLAALRALFDRHAEYGELLKALAEARAALPGLEQQAISRLLRRLRRDYETVRAIDYFPGAASISAEAAWAEFEGAAEKAMSPGEPSTVAGIIQFLDKNDFQNRVWATRRRLWVDRVASAWLIRRFIDREARFLWLDSPADCPAGALGFDFDGAAFTHVGERVTFEVLLASFRLEQDPGLQRIAAMVHALDVGGRHVPEAAGFEAMLSGARQRGLPDDQLLAEAGILLDSLHAHFSSQSQA
ncbi:MAG TPA: chromate resistance protein ChrB domain-containing protein [Noviherbaspirillum sp.]|uniref:chromate resistance protein ChrB domain-containing protein n=1 Tax=Noviherbaspirillum sp. TaxID=1926288 RepID=UPI002D695480|nr:chromate resistance protein ChrB domain-containing protein [Noviherbaspirillum sp.]HYD95452.1 chromate resistance protein ChrB domain-containing protein [Noviherbaspirillum sp.]